MNVLKTVVQNDQIVKMEMLMLIRRWQVVVDSW